MAVDFIYLFPIVLKLNCIWVCVNNFGCVWEFKSFMISDFLLSCFCHFFKLFHDESLKVCSFIVRVWRASPLSCNVGWEKRSSRGLLAVFHLLLDFPKSFICDKTAALLEAFWGYLSDLEVESSQEVKNVDEGMALISQSGCNDLL